MQSCSCRPTGISRSPHEVKYSSGGADEDRAPSKRHHSRLRVYSISHKASYNQSLTRDASKETRCGGPTSQARTTETSPRSRNTWFISLSMKRICMCRLALCRDRQRGYLRECTCAHGGRFAGAYHGCSYTFPPPAARGCGSRMQSQNNKIYNRRVPGGLYFHERKQFAGLEHVPTGTRFAKATTSIQLDQGESAVLRTVRWSLSAHKS